MTAFTVDIGDATGLRVVENSIAQALETVSDYVKLLAIQDVPNAKAVYEELKKRFSKIRHRRPLTDARGVAPVMT